MKLLLSVILGLLYAFALAGHYELDPMPSPPYDPNDVRGVATGYNGSTPYSTSYRQN